MSLTPWLEITITGFVYSLSVFVLLLLLLRKYNLKFDKAVREYLPFLAILIVFTAYVVGQATHVLMQKVIEIIVPSYEYDAVQQINIIPQLPEHFRNSYSTAYSNLVMFRHLTIGTLSLAILLNLWIGKGEFSHLKRPVFVLSTLFFILFCLSWRINAHYFAKTRDAIPIVFPFNR